MDLLAHLGVLEPQDLLVLLDLKVHPDPLDPMDSKDLLEHLAQQVVRVLLVLQVYQEILGHLDQMA